MGGYPNLHNHSFGTLIPATSRQQSMPFVTEANRMLPTLAPGSPKRAILDYLLHNAVGRNNARSWETIEAHCTTLHVPVDKLDFQQGFLAETRDGEVFIGSCSQGYFIIQDRDDAVVAAGFYRTRIARQQEHVDHLADLVRIQGWPPI
jgi:hypothetical protein